MKVIRLKLKDGVMSGYIRIPIDGSPLTPDNLFDKSKEEIYSIRVWRGNRQDEVKDLFDVSITGDAEKADDVKIIMEGDLSRVKRIGEGMKAGEIEIHSDVDMHCGAMMEGGTIRVKGNADCWAGREMKGGTIIIEGDAGDFLSSSYRGETVGMRNGKVIVEGNAGDYVGQYMAGGEILIKGNAGILAGLNMKGGKIIIEGDASLPGGSMTGGEIFVRGKLTERLPSFREGGTEIIDNIEYRKYVGDLAMGKTANGRIYEKK